ncbi:LuxR C-terminal-related transcriptional regulator [Amycolatopsis sp. NPDC049868]|uniref:helix-turn-helix transcriptional regulator n=1 Tax=Amycolatopsis sp. NPDC049868 TaxID=3363934 RepID=UPI0037AEC2C9
MRAERLVKVGTARVVAMRLAEAVLSSEDCGSEPDCVWSALQALINADNLNSANEHCRRLSRQPGWARSEQDRHLLTVTRARIWMLSGRSAEASELLEHLLAQDVGEERSGLVVAWLVEAFIQIGELDRAQGVLAERDLAGSLAADVHARAHILASRAALNIGLGQFSSAIDDYSTCGRILAGEGVTNPAIVPWRAGAALGAIGVRRFDLALALAEDELAAARRWGAPRAVGSALHVLALARRDEESLALLEQAVELFEHAQVRNELMHALYDLGAMHMERNDFAAGRSRFEAVGAVARMSANSFWRRRTDAALRRLPCSAQRPRLTRQECKTAQLARIGYSNRQIAEALSLQVRTVEFHLSATYRKLSISGRRELAAALASSLPEDDPRDSSGITAVSPGRT